MSPLIEEARRRQRRRRLALGGVILVAALAAALVALLHRAPSRAQRDGAETTVGPVPGGAAIQLGRDDRGAAIPMLVAVQSLVARRSGQPLTYVPHPIIVLRTTPTR